MTDLTGHSLGRYHLTKGMGIVLVGSFIFLGGCLSAEPKATPLPVSTQTLTSTPVPTNTSTPMNTPTPLHTPTATPYPEELVYGKDVTMKLVPAGEFKMGSNKNSSNEYPEHQVYLDAYYMDIYEVTNARYKVCVDAGICNPPGGTLKFNDSTFSDHPVVYVGWERAKTYCEWRYYFRHVSVGFRCARSLP